MEITVRGEPLVEIESGWELNELPEVRFRHFPLQHGRLEVEFVIRWITVLTRGSLGAQQGAHTSK